MEVEEEEKPHQHRTSDLILGLAVYTTGKFKPPSQQQQEDHHANSSSTDVNKLSADSKVNATLSCNIFKVPEVPKLPRIIKKTTMGLMEQSFPKINLMAQKEREQKINSMPIVQQFQLLHRTPNRYLTVNDPIRPESPISDKNLESASGILSSRERIVTFSGCTSSRQNSRTLQDTSHLSKSFIERRSTNNALSQLDMNVEKVPFINRKNKICSHHEKDYLKNLEEIRNKAKLKAMNKNDKCKKDDQDNPIDYFYVKKLLEAKDKAIREDLDMYKRRQERNPLLDFSPTPSLDLDILKMHVPQHWRSSKVDTPYFRRFITRGLNPSTEEYKYVKDKFTSTLDKRILAIDVVENPHMWLRYSLKVEEFKKKNVSFNEIHVFHGTNLDNVKSILSHNFEWQRAGEKIGGRYGCGISFARDASYALRYSDKHGLFKIHKNVMFMVRTMDTRSSEGDYDVVLPSYGVHTCVGAEGQVITKFRDDEFYPEYIIHFDRYKTAKRSRNWNRQKREKYQFCKNKVTKNAERAAKMKQKKEMRKQRRELEHEEMRNFVRTCGIENDTEACGESSNTQVHSNNQKSQLSECNKKVSSSLIHSEEPHHHNETQKSHNVSRRKSLEVQKPDQRERQKKSASHPLKPRHCNLLSTIHKSCLRNNKACHGSKKEHRGSKRACRGSKKGHHGSKITHSGDKTGRHGRIRTQHCGKIEHHCSKRGHYGSNMTHHDVDDSNISSYDRSHSNDMSYHASLGKHDQQDDLKKSCERDQTSCHHHNETNVWRGDQENYDKSVHDRYNQGSGRGNYRRDSEENDQGGDHWNYQRFSEKDDQRGGHRNDQRFSEEITWEDSQRNYEKDSEPNHQVDGHRNYQRVSEENDQGDGYKNYQR